ncbi:cupin domain-containing protein [Sphingomonas sp. CL5.1]|uniref:cupin domain-containing protein n=1 Tax=Sphingomonas sp. CL5.1 TaxID=2653203 RepID=UPI001583260C|nr:cupin domain-containing protein [Sphingomonas sp. CL5.1]QKR98416.1 cupin domain-containing protein [Sphingomonas sp. CL5.1]
MPHGMKSGLAAAAIVALGAAGLAAGYGWAQDEQPRATVNAGRPHGYYFSLDGKRRTFQEDGVANVEVVVPNNVSEGRYNVITSDWNADFKVPPHFHRHHAETFYVLGGEVEWTVEGETHVLHRGEAIFIPPNTVHSVRVVGGKPMRNLLIYEPGGYEDQVDFKMNYSAAELKDPRIVARIRAAGDFNLATDGK